MANSKQTKRALLTGTLAIVVCVAMLIGSTFAWFTDTASTAVNKIQAGNLKIELAYKNTADGEFAKADANTPVFKEGALWEPGHVEYVVLRVSNAGSLALKYKLGINIVNETGSTNVDGKTFNLSDYIRFAVIDGDKAGTDRDALVKAAGEGAALKTGYTSKEAHLLKTETKTVTLVVWMPSTVGNEANHKTDAAAPTIKLGINVYATQYTHENDSFDNTYDKDAKYTLTVDSVDALKIAAQNAKAGDEIVLAKDITLSETVRFAASGITFNGNGHTITAAMTDAQVENLATLLSFGYGTTYCTGVTVKDLTFTGKGGRAMHFHGGKSSLLQNVKISGEWSLAINFYGTHGAVMENCDISSTYANKYAKGSIFANEQSANQIILNNTKIDSLFVNATEAGATYANGGIKLVVGAGSVINELHTNKGITRTFHKVNGGTVGAVLADVD